MLALLFFFLFLMVECDLEVIPSLRNLDVGKVCPLVLRAIEYEELGMPKAQSLPFFSRPSLLYGTESTLPPSTFSRRG
jgi:hypothetical protein